MVFKKLLQAVGFSLCFTTAYANNETTEIKPSVLSLRTFVDKLEMTAKEKNIISIKVTMAVIIILTMCRSLLC